MSNSHKSEDLAIRQCNISWTFTYNVSANKIYHNNTKMFLKNKSNHPMNSQDLETLTNRLSFVRAVTSGELIIYNRSKDQILVSMAALNLDPMFIELPMRYFTVAHIISLENKIAETN